MNTVLPLPGRAVPSAEIPPSKPRAPRNFETHVREPAHRADDETPGIAPRAVMEATAGSEREIVPVDVRLTTVGMTGRVYPQELRAVGYLSMLERTAAPSAMPDGEVAKVLPSPTTEATVEAGMPLAARSAVTQTVASVAVAMSGVANAGHARACSESHAEAAREAGAAGGMSHEWVKRMMRLDGGAATLWIRDYRLDAVQRRALVEHLQRGARDAGMPLSRVVVNGKDIWRDGAWTQEQGEPHGR